MHSGPKNKNEKLESVENWLKFKIGQIGQKWKIGFQSCFLKKFIFAMQFQKRFWSFEQSVGLLRVQNMKWMKFYFGKVL